MEINTCNALVLCNNKILLGHRRSKYAKGMWCMPGGHVNTGESLKKCAYRELQEETGVVTKNLIKLLTVKEIVENDIFFHHFYFVEIIEKQNGWFTNKEPNNFYSWVLFDYENIPKKIINTHKTAINYFNNKFIK